MSNRNKSSSKRASKASKQSGLLETLTRSEKRPTFVDEDEPTGTVIDLDDDDPYKFVDSQSLLPDPGGWTAAGTTGLDDDDDDDDDDFTMTSLSKLTSAPATHRKAKDGPSSAGGVSTPKRSRMLGGATGSAKRKQTPKPKKSSVQQEEWSEEDMKKAIEASLQEKQKEDRRQRQKMRESKFEEEEQLLLAQYQSMAATAAGGMVEGEEEWREGGDNGAGKEGGEESTSGQPGLPPDQEYLIQQKPHNLNTEQQSSPIPVAGLASTATPQLKSVSIKKLSMKSLQTRKGRKTSDLLEEEEEDEGEVQIITLHEVGETTAASDEALNVASSSTSVKEISKGIERYCIEDEIVPDDDFDATPPILGEEREEKCEDTGGPQTVVSKPLSRGRPAAAASPKKQLVSDKQGERGKTKSTKTGLSLKKGRKRLSDSGNSSFQELPDSSGAQGPASKRPRIEVLNLSDHTEPSATKSSDMSAAARPELITNAELPTDASDVMEVEPEVNQAPPTEPSIGATASEMGSREATDNGDTDRVAKEAAVKPAVISLTGIEKTREIMRKGVDFTMNQKKINELREKSDKKEKLTAVYSSAVESAMETEDAAALPSAGRLQHKVLANTERASPTSSAKVADNRCTKNTAFQLVRRVKADGWPPVKIRPSETPRNSSLQAPPGVLPAEHTRVLVQCFNAYVAKLAMAQRKVLWRIKWGQPVSSFNKAGVNSLTSGRRTRRSRASSIPYSEYALDLKSVAPSSRSKSSSPMVSSKRSTPSKSPALSVGQQFSPSDENDSDSDFEPSKAMTKQVNDKKSNVTTRAGKTTVTTPTTKSQRAPRSRLTLGKKSPQLQERADKSLSPGVQFNKSLSPGVQFEREESPDILPPAAVRTHRQSGEPEKELSTKPSGRRLEIGVAAGKSTLSVSPLPPPATTSLSPRGKRSASPQFQDGDDNVMMLDLTSPSPPLLPAKPQGPKAKIDRDGAKGDGFTTNFSDGEKETLIKEKAVSSHAHVRHDTTDDSDEEGLPQSVATSTAATTGATSSSGSWLDSRKPPPSVQKTKSRRQPAKRTNNAKAGNGSGAQSKKKAGGGGGGGGGRGRRPAKTTTSAALRIKALIRKSDSEAESKHSSLEDSDGDSSSKETVPKMRPGQKPKLKRRRTMDSTDDSEVTDVELEERGGGREMDSSRVLASQTDPVGRGKGQKEVTGSNRGSHSLESVIDLTAESQLLRDHTPSPSPSRLVQSPSDGDGCISCPMCSKRFDSSVIQLHAEQCEGPESDNDHQWSESITRYTTTKTTATSVSKPGTGAAGGRKGGLSMGKRQAQREPGRGGRGGGREGGRGKKKSYQPSLMQLVNKEREVRGEEEIDSDTTTDDDPVDPDIKLDDADRGGTDPTASYYDDANLEWTEREEQQPSTTTAASVSRGAYGGGEREEGGAIFAEDGEGGFIIEPSPSSTPQPEAMAIEDGEGGYIVDPSMISNSPIRCFTRLSDMDPQERAWFEDQYKSKSSEGGRGGKGRKSQRGGGRRQLPMTSEERQSATWGRDDFGDLFNTDEKSKGQGRRGRGRGSYGGRRKYDWNRARNRGKGRGRAGSRTRGRRS